jgi:hypothetical protein
MSIDFGSIPSVSATPRITLPVGKALHEGREYVHSSQTDLRARFASMGHVSRFPQGNPINPAQLAKFAESLNCVLQGARPLQTGSRQALVSQDSLAKLQAAAKEAGVLQ